MNKKETENIEAPWTNNLITSIGFLRKDRIYQKAYEARLNKKVKILVEKLFGTKYDNISTNDIHDFVENLITRSYLLAKHFSKNLKYVINNLFEHPNIAFVDKSVRIYSTDFVLIHYIELNYCIKMA